MYFQTVLRYRFDLSAFGHPFPVPFPSLSLFRADDEQRVEWRGERERRVFSSQRHYRRGRGIAAGEETRRGIHRCFKNIAIKEQYNTNSVNRYIRNRKFDAKGERW